MDFYRNTNNLNELPFYRSTADFLSSCMFPVINTNVSGFADPEYALTNFLNGHMFVPYMNSSVVDRPKRRRTTTVDQRHAANIRERRRMNNLNKAFDRLRQLVPTFAYEKQLSRIETLRLAITYINFMTDVLLNPADNGNVCHLGS